MGLPPLNAYQLMGVSGMRDQDLQCVELPDTSGASLVPICALNLLSVTFYEAQAGPELATLLLQPLKCCDDRHMSLIRAHACKLLTSFGPQDKVHTFFFFKVDQDLA